MGEKWVASMFSDAGKLYLHLPAPRELQSKFCLLIARTKEDNLASVYEEHTCGPSSPGSLILESLGCCT